VFDLELPLTDVAEGYRAMDERFATKTLLRFEVGPSANSRERPDLARMRLSRLVVERLYPVEERTCHTTSAMAEFDRERVEILPMSGSAISI
jgi:hypothetical protein